jgi:hypothetical protein
MPIKQSRLSLDNQLVEEARVLGGHRTAREAVVAALRWYIRPARRPDILSDFGTVVLDPCYDYKGERERRRR